jgi:hypothetical protein
MSPETMDRKILLREWIVIIAVLGFLLSVVLITLIT